MLGWATILDIVAEGVTASGQEGTWSIARRGARTYAPLRLGVCLSNASRAGAVGIARDDERRVQQNVVAQRVSKTEAIVMWHFSTRRMTTRTGS